LGQSYVVTSSTTSPFLDVYPFTSGTGYGTRFSNPATLPAGGAIVTAPRFSPSGNAIVLAHTTTPRVTGYPFSSGGFGTKYADPATTPGTIGTGTSFISATEVAVSSIGTPSSMTFGFSSSSGWGSRNIGSPTSISGGTAVSARSNVAFFAYQNTPYIAMYPCTNPGLGTRYSAVSPTPTTTSSFGYGSHVSGSPNDVALAISSAVVYNVWPWTVGSGFGTRYTTSAPSGFGASGGSGVKFSKNGDYLHIGGTGANFAVYPWVTGTGPGTRFSAPASSIGSGTPHAGVFLNSDYFVGASSPYLFGYPYTSSGFGTKYSNPVGITAAAVSGVDAVFVPSATSMVASIGTFTLSGIVAGLKIGRRVIADSRSYAFIGNTAGLTVGRKVTASVRSFALTGIDATLTKTTVAGYTLAASVGSFSLAGQSTGLLLGRKVTASQGTFSLTGIDSELRSTRIMAASYGTYGLTGIPIRLVTTRIITASARSFALTGINNRLFISRKIIAASNAFLLTGNQANLITSASRSLLAAAGQFVLSGISSTLSKGSRALGSVGVFTVTRRPAGLVSTRIIVSGPGSYSLSGQPSTLAFGRKLPISSRQFVVSGIASDLFRTRSLYATPRQFLLTGNTAYLKTIHPPIICQAGVFASPYSAASLRYSNPKASQFPPRLQFNLTSKNVNLKPLRAVIDTMSFAMEQTACALRWHRV